MCWTHRTLLKLCTYTLLAALVGCSAVPKVPTPLPTLRPYAVHAPTLPCDQANRIAYRLVIDSGYTVTTLTLASATSTGIIEGSKSQALEDDTVTVKITCGADGVHAEGDYGHNTGAMNTLFPEYFATRFTAMSEVVERGEPLKPIGQMQVTMKPLIGLETKLEFGTEVTGVLPVRVEVVNTTGRAYILEAEKIVLLTVAGQRVKSLGASGNAFPTAPLANQRLTPGASLKEYLYFPPGTYTGARGFLIEEESHEREGFEVRF